jgi:2-methylcitrate dehydratase
MRGCYNGTGQRDIGAMAAPQDEMAELLAAFASGAAALDAGATQAAKRVLVDSIAVALAALRHRAAQAARRHAYRFPGGNEGCVIWGTAKRTTPEIAALANGVLLRCYDYNDFFVGQRNSGHPSDIVAGLIVAAEWANAPGDLLLTSLAVGYEAIAALFDACSTAPGGWDYTNLTGIGAACAIARCLGLSRGETREALAMTVIPHFASDEIESGELDSRGDLTMWKRFNGSDAVRNALQACLLASVGVEGAVRPFTGKQGFIAKLKNADDPLPVLRDRLGGNRPLARIGETFIKSWPVGSVAQSAIDAALRARAKLAKGAAIKRVRVFAEEGAYDHLVRIRDDPWHPISRETADHSLPYIVAAAVLDGKVTSDSFAPRVVGDPARQKFLVDKVTVEAAPELGTIAGGKYARAMAGYLSRVEIACEDGTVTRGEAQPPPGHPKNPLSDAALEAKLRDSVASVMDRAHVDRLAASLWSADRLHSVRELTALLAHSDSAAIDGAPAE